MSNTSDVRREFSFPAFNPAAFNPAAMRPFWAVMETSIARTEPVARNVACVQMATAAFVGNRARAQFELGSKLVGCRSPQAALETTMNFWQEAMRQYVSFAQECAGSYRTAMSAGISAGQAPAPARDLLILSEPNPVEQPARNGSTRWAA